MVLRELDADIIALQEVLSLPDNQRGSDHARFIAGELGFQHCFWENRKHIGQLYGNALVSRFPLTGACNYDISTRGREPRGCLRVDITLPGGPQLHVFNVHLGTSFVERRQQVRRLTSSEILNRSDLRGARIVLGDFNEWTSGNYPDASRPFCGSRSADSPESNAHLPRGPPFSSS
jgi:endonuclease/exonuclease/phosphatase family metal-dependent hydrolase